MMDGITVTHSAWCIHCCIELFAKPVHVFPSIHVACVSSHLCDEHFGIGWTRKMCPRGCPNDATSHNSVHEVNPTHIIVTMHALKRHSSYVCRLFGIIIFVYHWQGRLIQGFVPTPSSVQNVCRMDDFLEHSNSMAGMVQHNHRKKIIPTFNGIHCVVHPLLFEIVSKPIERTVNHIQRLFK